MTMTLENHVPPQNIDAEMAVLSAMLLDAKAIATAMELLEEKHFYKVEHRIIFRAISELFGGGSEVDTVIMGEHLKNNSLLEKIGGPVYLAKISTTVFTTANVDFHCRIVREKALQRGLITTCNTVLQTCYEESKNAEELLDFAEEEIFKLAHQREIGDAEPLHKIMPATLSLVLDTSLEERLKHIVPTGLSRIDRKMNGFFPGQLIILAARPGVGKSALATRFAFSAAANQLPAAIFSLEMPKEQIAYRLLAMKAGVDVTRIERGELNDTDATKLAQAASNLSHLPIYIDDSSYLTILDLRAKTRRLVAEYDLKMIVIDYIQLMTPHVSSDRMNREQQVATISRGLKLLAKELNIPVIALAQLNRGVAQRKDARPILSDLRESGSLEQDADVVIFIHRPPKDEEFVVPSAETTPEEMEILIRKNRNGPTFTVPVHFTGAYTRFDDIEEGYESEQPF